MLSWCPSHKQQAGSHQAVQTCVILAASETNVLASRAELQCMVRDGFQSEGMSLLPLKAEPKTGSLMPGGKLPGTLIRE